MLTFIICIFLKSEELEFEQKICLLSKQPESSFLKNVQRMKLAVRIERESESENSYCLLTNKTFQKLNSVLNFSL